MWYRLSCITRSELVEFFVDKKFLDYNIVTSKDLLDININLLLYESKVSQEFDTEDGSSLDIDCTRAYYTETEAATDRMQVRMNDAIDNHLCGNETASVIAKTQTFFGFGSQVHQ